MRLADRIREAVCNMRDRIARAQDGADDARWRRYVWVLLSGSLLGYLATVAFIAVIDPWKVLPASAAIERPVSGLNERLFFPMLVRTGRFDSFIFGNSTAMLIDPERLGREFGGRHFVTLAMPDARAWEQFEFLQFVLTQQPEPRTLMIMLDWVWCISNLEREEREIRRFPVWVYREPTWSNIRRLLNLQAFSHAVNAVKYQFGLYKPNYRRDGYWIFTPPDETYNAQAALTKIYGAGRRSPPPPLEPPAVVPEKVKKAWAFPWLDRMTEVLQKVPKTTQVLFVTMPVHAIAQPQPGSAGAQREEACKQRIAGIAASRGSFLIDFRIHSAVTRNDANYWDGLHYRVPVARRLEQAMVAAVRSGRPDPQGFWRIVDAR